MEMDVKRSNVDTVRAQRLVLERERERGRQEREGERERELVYCLTLEEL